MSLTAEGDQEPVSAELDVVTHHGQIHPNEFDREGIDDEFHFNADCALLMMLMAHASGRWLINLN